MCYNSIADVRNRNCLFRYKIYENGYREKIRNVKGC